MLVTNHCHGLQPPGVLSHSLFLSYFCRNLRIAWPVPPNTRQCLCLLSENGGGVCSWRGKLLIIIPRLDANYCVRQKMHVTCSPSADTFRSRIVVNSPLVLSILQWHWASPSTHTVPVRRRLLLLLSHSVVSNSLQPHGLQHTRLSWPSPWVCSNSPTESMMPPTHPLSLPALNCDI